MRQSLNVSTHSLSGADAECHGLGLYRVRTDILDEALSLGLHLPPGPRQCGPFVADGRRGTGGAGRSAEVAVQPPSGPNAPPALEVRCCGASGGPGRGRRRATQGTACLAGACRHFHRPSWPLAHIATGMNSRRLPQSSHFSPPWFDCRQLWDKGNSSEERQGKNEEIVRACGSRLCGQWRLARTPAEDITKNPCL